MPEDYDQQGWKDAIEKVDRRNHPEESWEEREARRLRKAEQRTQKDYEDQEKLRKGK